MRRWLNTPFTLPLLLLLVCVLTLPFALPVDAARGNVFSTRAIQALSSLINASGTLLAARIDTVQTWTAVQTFSAGTTMGRLIGAGDAPTCSSTGLGTGAAAISAGSTDLSGTCILSPTGAPGSSGIITLTFSTAAGVYGGSGGPICLATRSNGTGNWNVAAGIGQVTYSTTAPTLGWANNTVNLTAGSTYIVNYGCIGR